MKEPAGQSPSSKEAVLGITRSIRGGPYIGAAGALRATTKTVTRRKEPGAPTDECGADRVAQPMAIGIASPRTSCKPPIPQVHDTAEESSFMRNSSIQAIGACTNPCGTRLCVRRASVRQGTQPAIGTG